MKKKIGKTVRSFKKHWTTYVGALIVAILCVVALLSSRIATHDPTAIDLTHLFDGSSRSHFLGTDQNGSDVFSKLVYGAKTSMLVGLCTVVICVITGLMIGMICGYFGGWFDHALMRIGDIFQAFPGILLVMGIAAVLKPSVWNVIFALSVVGWISYARLVRSKVLTLRTLEYVLACKIMGASRFRIMVIHILPNLIGPLSVMATFGMAGAMIAEASLSFLGIGVPPTESSWGMMLDVGRQHLLDVPSLAIYPGLAIMMAVMAFNVLGDGLRDFFDPRS